MKNELPIIVDMFRHDTSYGRKLALACLCRAPNYETISSEKGVCWQGGEERRGSILNLLVFFVLVRAVGRRSVPLTFFSPAELLNKMKWSKPVPMHHHSLITLPAARSDAAVCCIRLHWHAFLTPPLGLMWYCSWFTSSLLCMTVFPVQKMLT